MPEGRIWSFRQLLTQLRADEAAGSGPAIQGWGTAQVTGAPQAITTATDLDTGVTLAVDPDPSPTWLDGSGFIQRPGLYRVGFVIQQTTPPADGTNLFWVTRGGDPLRFTFALAQLAKSKAAGEWLLPVSAATVSEGIRAAVSVHGDADTDAVLQAQPYIIAVALA